VNERRIVIRGLEKPGDLGWVVMTHGELYAEEFGWDGGFEALVARIVADFAVGDAQRQAAWIAEEGEDRVGCVFCVPADKDTAQLRLLLVDPSARGEHVGGRLVDTCIDFARSSGYRRLTLWTNDPLVAARSVYVSRGFVLKSEEAHHSFGVDLVGQVYELLLDA